MHRAALLALGLGMAAAVSFGQSFTLDFNAPVSGTLTDANGLGTGFTTRLPGTGSAIPQNDPGLQLSNGRLAVTSAHADIYNQVNMSVIETPCIVVPNISSGYVSIHACLRSITLLQTADVAGIIIGSSATASLRLIAETSGNIHLLANQGGPDSSGFGSPPGSFSPSDDIEFWLTRSNGLWTGSWQSPLSNGTLGPLSLPWLDSPSSLCVGVVVAHTDNFSQPFVAQFDLLDVLVACSSAGTPGQANSATARLEINGCGVGTAPGPFIVATAPLQPLTFGWQGAPLMPMILITGPMAATPFTLPGFGTIHIGTPPLFNDVLVVFDGAHMSGGLQLTTSPTGTAAQTVIVPAGTPPGTQIAVQGIVEQVAGTTTYGNLLTAAFRIDVL